jgi:hypothetical protein
LWVIREWGESAAGCAMFGFPQIATDVSGAAKFRYAPIPDLLDASIPSKDAGSHKESSQELPRPII